MRSPQGFAGSAEIHAVRSPSRAHAAATLASAPPNCRSSCRAVSKRVGDGIASRSNTSPSVTRSCIYPVFRLIWTEVPRIIGRFKCSGRRSPPNVISAG